MDFLRSTIGIMPNAHYRQEVMEHYVLRASSMTISPAATSVSLFAIAIVIPARIASSVGLSPTLPITALTNTSAPVCAATSTSPSSP